MKTSLRDWSKYSIYNYCNASLYLLHSFLTATLERINQIFSFTTEQQILTMLFWASYKNSPPHSILSNSEKWYNSYNYYNNVPFLALHYNPLSNNKLISPFIKQLLCFLHNTVVFPTFEKEIVNPNSLQYDTTKVSNFTSTVLTWSISLCTIHNCKQQNNLTPYKLIKYKLINKNHRWNKNGLI